LSIGNSLTAANTTDIERIYHDNYEKLYACAYRMIGRHADTEDVLQEAFLKVHQKLDSFRGEANLNTWIYRIVINESNRYFKRIKQLPVTRIADNYGLSEREFFNSIEYTPDFDDTLIIEEMREKCLQAFLRCMPKNQRVCFLLKTCLKLKNEEIAEVMDISEENVKVTLHRGRKRLKELFEMRCSLIDPDKPCKCHLWIKFMKDHNLEMPAEHCQIKTDELKKEHFRNMSLLRKIDYLYTVEAKDPKEVFISRLKKAVEIM